MGKKCELKPELSPEDCLLDKLGLNNAKRQHAEDTTEKMETVSSTSSLVANATTPAAVTSPERPWAEILETKATATQHLTLVFNKLTTIQKMIIAAALAWAIFSLISNFGGSPAPTLTSTCHTVHAVEYCRWSDGTYSMTMPDGAFYTRNTVNDPWEHPEPDFDWADRYWP